MVNHYFPDSTLNYIAADYVDSARQAAEHLTELGHRAIGIITGTGIQTSMDFLGTFKRHCIDNGVPEKNLPWTDGKFKEEEGFKAAQYLLHEYPNITAIMAGNDKMAIGAMHYLPYARVAYPPGYFRHGC